jgi:hypothetical protein
LNLARVLVPVAALSGMVALLSVPLNAVAGAPVHFQITDLNGAATEIPSGLPQARALLLLGFRHDDHAALDAWREGLGLSSRDSDWFEVPVIGVGNSMIRAVIVRGMRSGVIGAADRARFAPAFGDAAAIAEQLGVDPSAPAAVVVDRTGHVLAYASGAFDPTKAAALIHVLRP